MKVHEDHPAAAAHQPPRRDRRVDAAREQARDPPADADRQAAGAGMLAEEVERLVRQRLDVDGQLGVVEIDLPAARFLDPPADLALDLRRGQRKALVGPAHRDAERPRVLGARGRAGSRRRWRRRRAAPVRRARSSRRRRPSPADRARRPSRRRQPSTTSTRPCSARTCRTPRSAVASRILRTSRDDEPRPVVALERDLRVVDDDGLHEVSGCGMAEWPQVSRLSALSMALAAPWPLTTALSIVPGSPVSIQSPASHRPSTPVPVGGLAG